MNNPTSHISSSWTQPQTIRYQRAPVVRNVAIFQKYNLDKSASSFKKLSLFPRKTEVGAEVDVLTQQPISKRQTASVSVPTEIIPWSLYQNQDWTTKKPIQGVCASSLPFRSCTTSASDSQIKSFCGQKSQAYRFNNNSIKLIGYSTIHLRYQKDTTLTSTAADQHCLWMWKEQLSSPSRYAAIQDRYE